MPQQVAVAGGATGGAYGVIVYSENSGTHAYEKLECSFVVHHHYSHTVQIRTNTVQCHASHMLCTYVYVH